MPKIYDDSNAQQQTITKVQYAILSKWKGTAGTDWTNDWPPVPQTTITPDGLTRAALEASVGGAFFPGIEACWFLRDLSQPGAFDYSEPFRLSHSGHGAGDITKQMAVPWQADFYECREFGQGYSWWPAQRPDDVFPETGGGAVPWIRGIVRDHNSFSFPVSHQDMVDNWYKLGYVVKKSGAFVETERHVTCINIFLILDRSSFSDDEVNAALGVTTAARFEDSLYVVTEGFKPADLGLTPGVSSTTYTPATLQPIAPAIALQRANGNTAGDMSVVPQKVLAQIDPPPADQIQRFTFVYTVEFTSVSDFASDLEDITATATKTVAGKTYSSTGKLTLFKKANPYMLDGPTSWLSTDVRVFKVTEGQPLFGLPAMGNNAAAALSFIDSVVTQFRSPGSTAFDTISTDQQVSQLELAEQVGGKRVFNFAVARVRYRGNAGAPGVRVFFRLFTVAATGVDYDQTSTYRRTAGVTPISLLGLQANNVVTIPCYGRVRKDTSLVSLATQIDDLNVQDLQPLGNTEFQGYFGCWLDLNQVTKRFPLDSGGSNDGPWPLAQLKSVQELIRGMHQCLVAEVYFKDDLIPFGVSPATSDNLAQRNLAIVESANPGVADTRTVQHTFEIKATQPAPQIVFGGDATEQEHSARFIPAGPDELMIRWGNLPRSTRLTLYMPDVEADEVLGLAGQSYEARRLERLDAHTILCLPGDVTYVPLPTQRKRNIAALATLELPEGVKRDQRFNLFFHQISGRPRAVLGSFQMTIPVSTKEALLEPEIRKLSVLRHIANSIPPEDQWHPVFLRYLGQIEDRVRGFGGNPDRVAPSPAGTGRDDAAERCSRRGLLLSFLLALLVVVAGLPPTPPYVVVMVLVAAAVVATIWWKQTCSPSPCRLVNALIVGLGLGAAVLAALVLAGLTGPFGSMVLGLAALLLGILIVVGMQLRCFKSAGG
ncbi:MAG: LodA/GoxA family CTQ-dependent oxidase [Pyrinomonadaceae bacterium]